MTGRKPTLSAPHGTIVCAIYTRKSTEEGLDREFNTLDAQRDAAEAYIQSQASEGWVVSAEHYDDGGYSGATLDRPALQRLLGDIRSGKAQRIVVYKIDRLSRSLLGFAELARTFDACGVGIVSVTQQLDTSTSMGRLTLNMLLSFAQFEREMISDRTRDKLQAARRKGKFTGGTLILGYDRHPLGGKLLVNEAEAQRVREIFRLFLKIRSVVKTVQELARRDWTLKRWTTRQGKEYGGGPFDTHNLKRLVTNPAYIGEIHLAGKIFPAEHEPIVDRRTWERAKASLASPRSQKRVSKSEALLGGILRCGPCDAAMTPVHSQKGSYRYHYYLCLRAHRQGRAVCPSKSLPAREIERFVLDRLFDMAQSGLDACGEDPRIDAGALREALRSLHLPWEEGRSQEHGAGLRRLIDRIEYDGASGGVAFFFDSEGVVRPKSRLEGRKA